MFLQKANLLDLVLLEYLFAFYFVSFVVSISVIYYVMSTGTEFKLSKSFICNNIAVLEIRYYEEI